jgi:hypothetical protein
VGGGEAAPVYLDDDEPEVLPFSRPRRVSSALSSLVVVLALLPLGPFVWWVELPLVVLAIVLAIPDYRSQRRDGLELHRAFLVVRRRWSSRAAAACDIEDIRLERRRPWSSRNVTIVMKDGKRHLAPSAGRGKGLLRPDFERDLQRIREWWLANRELDVVVVNVNRTGAAT